jgi:hypothetical protein
MWADVAAGSPPGWKPRRYRIRRSLEIVLVERCWFCLEQPAVTTVHAADGRECPACDVCATEQPKRLAADRVITDDDLRRIVGDISA